MSDTLLTASQVLDNMILTFVVLESSPFGQVVWSGDDGCTRAENEGDSTVASGSAQNHLHQSRQ